MTGREVLEYLQSLSPEELDLPVEHRVDVFNYSNNWDEIVSCQIEHREEFSLRRTGIMVR